MGWIGKIPSEAEFVNFFGGGISDGSLPWEKAVIPPPAWQRRFNEKDLDNHRSMVDYILLLNDYRGIGYDSVAQLIND
jgi:hypothetical protein